MIGTKIRGAYNVDSTDSHAYKFNTSPNNIQFTINSKLDKLTLRYPDAPNGYVIKDIFFDKKKEKVAIDEYQGKVTNSIYIRLFILNEKHDWDIVKLTNECFVLKGNSNGNNYRFEFIK